LALSNRQTPRYQELRKRNRYVAQELKCYIVEDLLPGYIDGLLGKETTSEVAQHLDKCNDYRSSYEKMKSLVNTPSSQTADKEVDF